MGKSVHLVLLVVVLWCKSAWAALELSPSFLGMYRKTMRVENELHTHAARYGVDPRLARAVLIQESGGNANLVSAAGARGYFQVMPKTFRMLRVRTNIEAGVKYLAQLQKRFGREDYAIAAYNAGPGTIAKDRPLRLETLQYVISVGHYRSVLRLHEPEIRRQAGRLQLRRVHTGDSWETLAEKLGVPHAALFLYNPFLAARPLQAGSLVAYPTAVPENVLEYEGDELYYTSRIGDSYLNLALIFGVDLETFRQHNDLWRLQQLPAGVRLRVAAPADSPFRRLRLIATARSPQGQPAGHPTPPIAPRTAQSPAASRYTVRRGDTLEKIARRHRTTVRELMRANGLRGPRIHAGVTLRIPAAPARPRVATPEAPPKKVFVYKVRRGDTLHTIARRYHTTVQALMRTNGLRTSRLRAGESLRIPDNSSVAPPP
jgi:LysM repeat protein